MGARASLELENYTAMHGFAKNANLDDQQYFDFVEALAMLVCRTANVD